MFTPLVFSTSEGMARECINFYKRLTSMQTEKRKDHYAQVLGWLWCRISFAREMSGAVDGKGVPIPQMDMTADSRRATCKGKVSRTH